MNRHIFPKYSLSIFILTCLSLIGSFLSVINLIPLMTTYQLIEDSKNYQLSKYYYYLIYALLILSIILTCFITIFYTNIG